MLELLIYALLTLGAGACVVTQQALNANLRTALDSAAWSGVVSYATGLACMIALALAVRDPFPFLQDGADDFLVLVDDHLDDVANGRFVDGEGNRVDGFSG